MSNDALSASLDELSERIANSQHEEVYLRVNAAESLTQIYLYMSRTREYWLSIFYSDADLLLTNIPSINGLKIANVSLKTGQKGTIINREASQDEEVYRYVLIHLIGELGDFGNVRQAQRRLQHILHTWQEFFKGNKRPLDDQAQLGLMGELLILQKRVLTQLEARKALSAWKGPTRGRHDFVFSTCHIEVKSCIDSAEIVFNINGENQLAAIDDKSLFLFNPVFDISDSGQCLPELILGIQSQLGSDQSAIDLMETLLAKVGYHSIHGEYYFNEGLKLLPSTIHIYHVKDDFPRLVPGSSGRFITVNEYAIDAKACDRFRHNEEVILD